MLGVFTLATAAEAGLTRGVVRHKVATGTWRRIVGAAFMDVGVPSALDPVRLRAIGAALTWPDAVICHGTAALLHGLPVADDGHAHVLLPHRRQARHGLVPHYMEATEVRPMLSFRLTGARSTALDCLALLPFAEAERLMAWVRTREVITVSHLAADVEERRGRPGVEQLRRLLAMTRDGALSEAERRLHQILRGAGIQGWETNQPMVVGARVVARADVLFRAPKVIVEVDGRLAHADFEVERQRLNALTLAGYTVLRFTWRQLVDRPWQVREQVEEALRLARR